MNLIVAEIVCRYSVAGFIYEVNGARTVRCGNSNCRSAFGNFVRYFICGSTRIFALPAVGPFVEVNYEFCGFGYRNRIYYFGSAGIINARAVAFNLVRDKRTVQINSYFGIFFKSDITAVAQPILQVIGTTVIYRQALDKRLSVRAPYTAFPSDFSSQLCICLEYGRVCVNSRSAVDPTEETPMFFAYRYGGKSPYTFGKLNLPV